jgi:catechol 2,3-dioxygenase-like lactoylglutathione lyase family enzyme
MIDHVSLGTTRFDEAIAFYEKCFAVVGYSLRHREENEAAFGAGDQWDFWLYPVAGGESVVGARSHVAVAASSREEAERFVEVAVAAGAAVVRPAGERPDISPAYFGAVIRDLDGHTIEVVHWSR